LVTAYSNRQRRGVWQPGNKNGAAAPRHWDNRLTTGNQQITNATLEAATALIHILSGAVTNQPPTDVAVRHPQPALAATTSETQPNWPDSPDWYGVTAIGILAGVMAAVTFGAGWYRYGGNAACTRRPGHGAGILASPWN
jgi:hypothetical protein